MIILNKDADRDIRVNIHLAARKAGTVTTEQPDAPASTAAKRTSLARLMPAASRMEPTVWPLRTLQAFASFSGLAALVVRAALAPRYSKPTEK